MRACAFRSRKPFSYSVKGLAAVLALVSQQLEHSSFVA
jgi:hypothetical protein